MKLVPSKAEQISFRAKMHFLFLNKDVFERIVKKRLVELHMKMYLSSPIGIFSAVYLFRTKYQHKLQKERKYQKW